MPKAENDSADIDRAQNAEKYTKNAKKNGKWKNAAAFALKCGK